MHTGSDGEDDTSSKEQTHLLNESPSNDSENDEVCCGNQNREIFLIA